MAEEPKDIVGATCKTREQVAAFFEDFDRLISQCWRSTLADNERRFIMSLRERRDTYCNHMRVTPKQMRWLEQIAHKDKHQ